MEESNSMFFPTNRTTVLESIFTAAVLSLATNMLYSAQISVDMSLDVCGAAIIGHCVGDFFASFVIVDQDLDGIRHRRVRRALADPTFASNLLLVWQHADLSWPVV